MSLGPLRLQASVRESAAGSYPAVHADLYFQDKPDALRCVVWCSLIGYPTASNCGRHRSIE